MHQINDEIRDVVFGMVAALIRNFNNALACGLEGHGPQRKSTYIGFDKSFYMLR